MRTLYVLAALCLIPTDVFAYGIYHGGSGGLSALVMAAAAIAGYWVLKRVSSDKDAKQARWAGAAVGWVLVVVGLLGFICASVNHSRKSFHGYKSCALHGRKSCALKGKLWHAAHGYGGAGNYETEEEEVTEE